MFYHLAMWAESSISSLNLFGYLTFRSILGVLTALIVSLLAGPWMIARLHDFKFGQVVRDVGPQSHLAKTGTPPAGGVSAVPGIGVKAGGRIPALTTHGQVVQRGSGYGNHGCLTVAQFRHLQRRCAQSREFVQIDRIHQMLP